jgi:sugar transferase EpsL
MKMYQETIKPIFDKVMAFAFLIIFSPLLMVVALVVLRKHGTPVLFSQERAGLHGRPFMIYKFRTMTNDTNSDGEFLSDEKRLTKFGKFLRSTSLDELPEFWNVIKGDMSLVGPRPLYTKYLDEYTTEQKRRHDVLPGITGFAQVNGRNATSWEERFKQDLYYIDNLSFSLDLKIIWKTIWKTIARENINQPGHVTMQEFTRSEK